MSYLNGKLVHPATLWAVSGGDGFGGDTVAAPVLINTFWEERQENFYGALDRRELVSNAVVFTNQAVAVGDYLARGDHRATADPALVASAFKAQRSDLNTDLRNLESVRRVIL